jgi:hypothetical protein
MSDAFGRIAGFDPAFGLFSLPLWIAGAAAALLVVFSVVAFNHAGREGAIGALARVALLLIGVGVTWLIFDVSPRRSIVAERQALEARAHELLARGSLPGSTLGCLDSIAGETVETSCEKALFQTPEATAAAVSYVSAQLTLLADLTAHAKRSAAGPPVALASMRRAVEADRFGLVARVLAVRDGCTPDACGAFALLNDTSKITANLAERTYELFVERHSADWPTAGKSPVASSASPAPAAISGAPAASPGATAGAGKGADLFFPSAASIPPVNIMTAEPPAPPEGAAAPTPSAAKQKATPARRPAQSNTPAQSGGTGQSNTQAGAPVDLNAAARSAPPAPAPQ